ncbi:hypothetical protein Poly41_71620 [Novipirellula artificiosorum]|uniref:Uncharacterized protein n=1 Tax=Novipirellula artificiosorum TaxID=2528016 RepID=A0A5C6CEU5_9BACT|nr:hypothetical protein Poly41_71620 [Novipirellula artificiosorum]
MEITSCCQLRMRNQSVVSAKEVVAGGLKESSATATSISELAAIRGAKEVEMERFCIGPKLRDPASKTTLSDAVAAANQPSGTPGSRTITGNNIVAVKPHCRTRNRAAADRFFMFAAISSTTLSRPKLPIAIVATVSIEKKLAIIGFPCELVGSFRSFLDAGDHSIPHPLHRAVQQSQRS